VQGFVNSEAYSNHGEGYDQYGETACGKISYGNRPPAGSGKNKYSCIITYRGRVKHAAHPLLWGDEVH
jgi:hypothetical protein